MQPQVVGTTAPPLPMRAVIYARLSKEEEGSVSIESQIQQCRELCGKRGFSIIGEFYDADVSGITRPTERPECSKAIQAARSRPRFDGDAVAFIVAKVDRFGRDPESMFHAIRALGKYVEFISCAEPVDLRTSSGRAMFGMMAVMGAFERDRICERTKDSSKARSAKGLRVSRDAPYGKRFIVALGEDGKPALSRRNTFAMQLEDCPEEQEILSIVGRLYEAGWKGGKIANALNERGHRRRNGTLWTNIHVGLLRLRNQPAMREAMAKKMAPLPASG